MIWCSLCHLYTSTVLLYTTEPFDIYGYWMARLMSQSLGFLRSCVYLSDWEKDSIHLNSQAFEWLYFVCNPILKMRFGYGKRPMTIIEVWWIIYLQSSINGGLFNIHLWLLWSCYGWDNTITLLPIVFRFSDYLWMSEIVINNMVDFRRLFGVTVLRAWSSAFRIS